jgi:hypothetical protein
LTNTGDPLPLSSAFQDVGRRKPLAPPSLSSNDPESVVMKILLRAAAVVLVGALSSPAIARPRHHPAPVPVTTIHFHGGSVGFIVGVGGASGVVRYRGVNYPIDVSGLKVGTIGVNSYDVVGRVYNLHRLSDIEGSYAAGEASATAGAGAGGIDMTNGNGVEIRASSTSSGLQLTLGAGGVTITLKH